LATTLVRLSSSAPTLESLSLSHKYLGIISDNLFSGVAPNLKRLELENCDISWKSPLLKGLQNLQISTKGRAELEDWLNALNEMPKLQTLSLQSTQSTLLVDQASPFISEHTRIITLPSLTHFHIHALADDCALALAHLLLPALTWLHVDVKSHDREGEDVELVIPYVARNVYVLQDIEAFRSILIAGERRCTEVYAWAMPGADVEISDLVTLGDKARSACFQFAAKGDKWGHGVESAIFDAILTFLPVDSVSTLTAQNHSRLSKRFWLRWPLLEQARLVPTTVGVFGGMLAEDTPPDGPRLPSLTRLILLNVKLTTLRTSHLGNMLIKRVEQGVPLECLDLRTCVAAKRAIQLLAEIVVDLQEPLEAAPIVMEEFFNQYKVKFYDRRRSWHWDTDDNEDYSSDEDEDEESDEDEDEESDEDEDEESDEDENEGDMGSTIRL
jgi:hypothetical protein